MFDYIKRLGKDKLPFLNQSDNLEEQENESIEETPPPSFKNYNQQQQDSSIRPINSNSSPTKLNKYQQARRRQVQQQQHEEEQEEYDPYRISEVERDFNQHYRQQSSQEQPLYQSTPPTRRNVRETSVGLGVQGTKTTGDEIDSTRRRGYRVNNNNNNLVRENYDDSHRFDNEEEQDEEGEEFLRDTSIINRSGGNVFDGSYNYPEEDQQQQNHYNNNNEQDYERPPSAYRPRSHYQSQQQNMYSTTDTYNQQGGEGDEEKATREEENELSFDALDWNEKNQALDDPNELESDWIPATPASLFSGGFGAPPQTAQLRRNRTNRRVKLTAGNLVLDCAIPTRLMSFLPRKEGNEFKYTRYTAVTCGPDEFDVNRFTLRPTLYNRQTELLIVVTLYNENEVLFCRTLHGVMKNIAHLCTRNKSKTWGKDGWKKVVVCIVADGRRAINPRILDCLSALGVYQEGMAKNVIDNKKVEAHIYEYTTQLSIDPELKFKGMEKGIVPTQIMFCLKESKLNSHRWALQAFAPQLDPNIVILLDVGTKPGPKSLYYLWKTFDLNSNVGGACGEICAMKGKVWQGLFNPLVAAQNFEYKMSNILDKPTESVFGYITVLPGAFSAYRYIALKNDALGHGPLNSYFKGEHLAGYDADVFTSNMYLAEDRILCWELVAKAGHAWVLKFVKSAQAETDVPDQIAEFISQRRRWLNGSFFAGTYALTHTMQLLKTEHSVGKKVALIIQAFYNLVNLMFSWFGIGNYWIFFMVLTTSLEDPSFNLKGIQVANAIIQYLYMGTVVACFLFAMGNRPQGSKWKYLFAMIIFAFTTAYMLGAAAFAVLRAVKGSSGSLIYAQIVISLLATYGTYIISSILSLDPWHLVTSMPQYMLFAPIYINLLNIFAFSNLHDFSWGTKEQTSSEVDLGVAASAGKDTVDITLPSAQADIDGAYDEALHKLKTRPMIVPRTRTFAEKQATVMDYYKNVRTNVLLAWTLSNALLVTTILQGDYSSTFSSGGGNGRTQEYLVIILVFVALMAVIRLAGSTTYLVARLFSG